MHLRHDVKKTLKCCLNLSINVSRDFFSISGCHGNISGPVTSFPVPASIPCSAELSGPVPKNRPRGRGGHVGQIRLSDWLKFEILASDWSGAKPGPYTTRISFSTLTGQKHADLYAQRIAFQSLTPSPRLFN